MPTSLPTLADIRAAEARIRPTIPPTPFLHSRTLSQMFGCELWLKFENLNFTASFKERGALNKLLLLTPQEREKGVVAVSAGNHALALAFHARRVGVKATIVMPVTAPAVKVMGARGFGAEVILHGKTFADAAELLPALTAERGLILCHPFDDPAIVAGQGTAGIEMLNEVPELDTLVVPVGGGGLIGGIATAAKAMKPQIRVLGVQTELYSGMAGLLGAARSTVAGGPSVAEGIAVKEPGASRARSCAPRSTPCSSCRKRPSRMRWRCFSRSRRRSPKARARPALPRSQPAGSCSRGARSERFSAAAISTCNFWFQSCTGRSPGAGASFASP